MLKYILTLMLRIIFHGFMIFPIKNNCILFYPENGNYYCNLKYIDQLMRKNPKWDLIWVYTNDLSLKSYGQGIRTIKRHSITFLYYAMTAKVVLFNNWYPAFLPKRKRQIYINTWHGGGAYKKIDSQFRNNPNKWARKNISYIYQRIDFFVSSCEAFSKSIMEDTGISINFVSHGMPRNDLFFDKEKVRVLKSYIRDKYNIAQDIGIVLYAPTFRDNGIKLDLNVKELLNALQKRFNKRFVLFVRSHPHIAKDIFIGTENHSVVFDVSSYVDMQELLCASDVLITDYSSSMWDFSLTGKPCFIYANDLEKYKKERNFHTLIVNWPFPLAERNKELKENILNFDEKKYLYNLRKHHAELGSYESGVASWQICCLIEDICYGKNAMEKT